MSISLPPVRVRPSNSLIHPFDDLIHLSRTFGYRLSYTSLNLPSWVVANVIKEKAKQV
jgi:hypothetical protein